MRMHVPLASLGTLLDLPAGVSVVGVDVAGGPISPQGVVELYLEGVRLEIEGEIVTAEYSVDAKGHRSFLRFKAPEPAPAPPEQLDTPAPVTEIVGDVAADAPAKAAGAGKKAGS
jgi:hypothetical protein